MFGKLLKHDLKNSYRDYVYLYIAMMAYALLMPLILRFGDSQSLFIGFIIVLPTMILVIGGVIIMFRNVFSFIHRRLYSEAGYLTFSLPVPTWQILLSKVLTLMIWSMVTGLLTFVSMAIFFVSFRLEIAQILNIREVQMVIDVMVQALKNLNWGWVALSFVEYLFGLAALFTLIIGAMSLARSSLIKSRRYLVPALVFFGIILVWGMLSNVLMVTIFGPEVHYVSSSSMHPDFMIDITNTQSVWQYTAVSTVWSVVSFVLAFMASNWVLENKLEL